MYGSYEGEFEDVREEFAKEAKARRRALNAILRCKGDPSECFCIQCNPPEEDDE